MNRYKKILSCWHKLEHFSPATTPKSSEENVCLLNSEQEPWKIPLKSKDPNKMIEYSIFLGVFDSKIVNNFINDFFKVKDNEVNSRDSKISFASLKLDEQGKYINDSFGFSTLPWALGQLENNKIESNHWENDFNQAKYELIEYLELIFKETITNSNDEILKVSKIVTSKQLTQLQTEIEKKCNWSVKPKTDIYIKRIEKYKPKTNKDNNVTSDILNSFYIKDLEKIIANYDKKSISNAFKQYLNGSLNKFSDRTDVVKDVNRLKQVLSTKNIPDGCWPSEYTLSLMQQFAVNTIFNNLKDENQSGIFSVNGPPGTGKTTLLRDVIAPIIVDRAKKLTQITNPADAFTKVGQIEINDNFSPWIYQPIKSITNGGIVIASSNNGAVENISKELPLKKEVSKNYQDKISYFKKVAENCIDENNWGIVSAVLGNKENRNNLVSSLWFNKDFKDLQKTLKEDKLFDNLEWDNIKKEFENKLLEITREKSRLEQFQVEYTDFIISNKNLNKIIQNLENTEKEYNTSKLKLANQKNKIKVIKYKKSATLSELTIIKESKPNIFVYLFNSRRRNLYKIAYNNALKAYNEITDELNTQTSNFDKLESKYSELERLFFNYQKQKNDLEKKLEILTSKIKNAKNELKNNFVDNNFWENIESKETQESCPWYSQKLKKLNSELFVISLKLHEIFILTANGTNAEKVSRTLSGFFEYLKGNKDISKTEVKAMWDTFFLVIPIVSSTFASIQTMFKDLEQEDLPWLFIDEAGQAVPQAAVGAIWRSKRVGVVGDPFQIEPVVTIPNSITDNISNYFDLTTEQVNSELSVQSMADRINPLGTYLTINSKKEWIGIPLRVHRRCISPMFEVANSIAYNNTMYNSTKPKDVAIKFKTQFIDCKGSVEGRHFVPEQAEIIKKILVEEINTIKDFPNVFVITPFSEVSYKLNSFLFRDFMNELKKYKDIKKDEINQWLKQHIGTVHTFQGKQAEGVILCLGLDKKSKGAANWASQKPNLLNVAITRAKYRFIAVGDKDIWLKQPYFNKLNSL